MWCDYFLRWAIRGDYFTDFSYVKINGYFVGIGLILTAVLQALNKLRLVAISGLNKKHKIWRKLTRYVLLLYTKLIQQNILKQYTPKCLIMLTSNNFIKVPQWWYWKVSQWWHYKQFKRLKTIQNFQQWWHLKQAKTFFYLLITCLLACIIIIKIT